MESHSSWLLLLFLPLQFSGIANLPVQKRLHPMKGILGGSVMLHVIIPPIKPVSEIEWKFEAPTGLALLIAEFMNGELVRPNPSDRFGQRLDMADSTTLRIKALELGDSGVFKARVKFATSAIQEHSFSLTVYEPVPAPEILHRLLSNTPEGCNVTLQCQAPRKGGFDVSWKRGNPFQALEEDPERYQLSDNDTVLHLSWQKNTSDSTITCLVSNPADLRNASFDLLNICKNEGVHDCFSWVRIVIAVGLVVQIATVTFLKIMERKHWGQS